MDDKKVNAEPHRTVSALFVSAAPQEPSKLTEKFADTGMAFVVATHRGMEHAELLPRLLAEVTGMPVTEIQEGLRLEPNRIFLMPPHMHMTMAGPYRSTPFYVPLPRRSDRSRLPSFSPAWETTGARV